MGNLNQKLKEQMESFKQLKENAEKNRQERLAELEKEFEIKKQEIKKDIDMIWESNEKRK